jgi:hypothetical protein
MVDTHVTVVHVVKLRKIWVRSSIQDTRDDKHGSYIYLAWYVLGEDRTRAVAGDSRQL